MLLATVLVGCVQGDGDQVDPDATPQDRSGAGIPAATSAVELPPGDGGGQTSDGTGFVAVPASSGCASERAMDPAGALDQDIPALGFAPADVLTWTGDGVDASLTWVPRGDATITPEPDSSRLEMRVAMTDVEARFFDGKPDGNPGEETGMCPPFVELHVEVEIDTPDGALAERVPAILRAARPGVVDLMAVVPGDALTGTLELVPNDAGAPVTFSLFVQGTFTEHGSYGRLTAREPIFDLTQARGSLGRPIALVAAWPVDLGCAKAASDSLAPWGPPASNLALAEDVQFGDARVDEWLAAFSEPVTAGMRWDDGQQSQVSAEVQVTSPACFYTDWLEPRWSYLTYGVEVTVATDDRSWAGTYAGITTVSAWDSPAPQVRVEGVELVALDDQAALGVLGVTAAAEAEIARAGPIDQLELRWGLWLDDQDSAPGVSVDVHARRDRARCEGLGPTGTDACLSNETAALLRASTAVERDTQPADEVALPATL